MSIAGSVTAWIGRLQAGEETALGKLHERYWPQLVELARQRLKGAPGRAADEEDVAQEAFWSFYRRLRSGQPFRLTSRHDLLALLTHIIACKAVNQLKHEFEVQKRGGGKIRDETALNYLAEEFTGRALENAPQAAPGPVDQAILQDCYRYYVEALPDRLRPVAEFYLAGFTHKEIADRLDCVERTIERKMALIFQKWQDMALENVNEEQRATD